MRKQTVDYSNFTAGYEITTENKVQESNNRKEITVFSGGRGRNLRMKTSRCAITTPGGFTYTSMAGRA